jgi:hypothetical protein
VVPCQSADALPEKPSTSVIRVSDTTTDFQVVLINPPLLDTPTGHIVRPSCHSSADEFAGHHRQTPEWVARHPATGIVYQVVLRITAVYLGIRRGCVRQLSLGRTPQRVPSPREMRTWFAVGSPNVPSHQCQCARLKGRLRPRPGRPRQCKEGCCSAANVARGVILHSGSRVRLPLFSDPAGRVPNRAEGIRVLSRRHADDRRPLRQVPPLATVLVLTGTDICECCPIISAALGTRCGFGSSSALLS